MDILGLGYSEYDFSKLVESYCHDLNYLTDLLAKLSGTYNLLISSADGFNRIALSKKGDVKDSIHMAEELGSIMDEVIDALDTQTSLYINYLKIKDDFISKNFPFIEIIKSEVDNRIRHEVHDGEKHD